MVEKMKILWKNSVSWGKWKSWLPWFQSIFRFFSKSKIDPIIWVLRFLKSKGGPFGEENLKKIDFYVWYLKRTALKNVDWQWNRFLKILIFGEVMDQKVLEKWLKSPKLLKMPIFRYFLVHNSQKSIFLKTDFTANLHFSRRFFWGIKQKNLFFSYFWFLGT